MILQFDFVILNKIFCQKKINLRISPNSSVNKTNENINLNETYQLKDTTSQNRSVLTPLMSLKPCGLF